MTNKVELTPEQKDESVCPHKEDFSANTGSAISVTSA